MTFGFLLRQKLNTLIVTCLLGLVAHSVALAGPITWTVEGEFGDQIFVYPGLLEGTLIWDADTRELLQYSVSVPAQDGYGGNLPAFNYTNADSTAIIYTSGGTLFDFKVTNRAGADVRDLWLNFSAPLTNSGGYDTLFSDRHPMLDGSVPSIELDSSSDFRQVFDGAAQASIAPEPGAFAMLSIGLLGSLVARYRKNRAN